MFSELFLVCLKGYKKSAAMESSIHYQILQLYQESIYKKG